MRFENDTIGLLEINWLTPTKIRELWVTGERGMFRVDYLIQDLYFYANAATEVDDWDALRSFRGVSEGEMTRFPIAKREPLRAELEAFVEAARTGIAPAAATEGAIALDLALRLIESARANQVQELTRILS
jgi:predicted dehydrogenase